MILAYTLKKQIKKKDILSQYAWVIIVILGIYIGSQVGDIVKEKDYTIRCIRINKQHYSNVHWLKLYTRALKGGQD